MLKVGEWVDKTHEIADSLEHGANLKKTRDIEKAIAYNEGYVQAIEDYAKQMREAIAEEQG